MSITWIEALAALTALGLFAYLGYALLRPEKFWRGRHASAARPDFCESDRGLLCRTAGLCARPGAYL